MTDLTAPRLEGTVAVDDRRLSFAEFGSPRGRAMIWMHGTPGASRQVPEAARIAASELDVRIVCVDRPGAGRSTPHRYGCLRDFATDLTVLLDALGIEDFGMIGLSGGGPYVLACAAAMPHRIKVAGLIGSVAPTCGPDAAVGGPVALTRKFAPAISRLRLPLSLTVAAIAWGVRPLATPALLAYSRVSPEPDRRMLARPEFRAMFLDDLLHGSRFGLRAPIDDLILFGKDWCFELADVTVPMHVWHGDADHIVPFAHGEHLVSRLPDAQLHVIPGESHLGGLGEAEAILQTLMQSWNDRQRRPRRGLAPV